jgi:hypothetical protein
MKTDTRIVDKYTLSNIQYIIHEANYGYDLKESKKHKSHKKYLLFKLNEINSLLEGIRIRDRGEGDIKKRDEINSYLRERRKIAGITLSEDGKMSINNMPVFPMIEGAEYKWIGDGDYFTYIPFED